MAISGHWQIPIIPASDEYGSTTLQSTTASGPESSSQLCSGRVGAGIVDIAPTFETHIDHMLFVIVLSITSIYVDHVH